MSEARSSIRLRTMTGSEGGLVNRGLLYYCNVILKIESSVNMTTMIMPLPLPWWFSGALDGRQHLIFRLLARVFPERLKAVRSIP